MTSQERFFLSQRFVQAGVDAIMNDDEVQAVLALFGESGYEPSITLGINLSLVTKDVPKVTLWKKIEVFFRCLFHRWSKFASTYSDSDVKFLKDFKIDGEK